MYESNSTQTIKPSRSLLWSDIDGFFCCLVNVIVFSYLFITCLLKNAYINKNLLSAIEKDLVDLLNICVATLFLSCPSRENNTTYNAKYSNCYK